LESDSHLFEVCGGDLSQPPMNIVWQVWRGKSSVFG
jgi:hypothetical protein